MSRRILKICIDKITYYRDAPQKVKGKISQNSLSNPPIELDVKLNM